MPVENPSPHRINMPKEQQTTAGTPVKKTTFTAKRRRAKQYNATLSPANKKPLTGAQGRRKQAPVEKPKALNNSNASPVKDDRKITEYFQVRRSVRKPKQAALEEKQRDFEKKVMEQWEEGLEV